MAELRYNPLLRDWTMVSADRQRRPQTKSGECPFCPGSGKVPQAYEVYAYDNDFPMLSGNPPEPDDVAFGPYSTQHAYGKCEVVLYSSDHDTSLSSLPTSRIRMLVDLWVERFRALSQDERHKYILIFENRGAEVGATISHPHGQIYAYPYIPLKLQQELHSCEQYYTVNQRCLLCDMGEEERRFGKRILVETEYFESYIPFFTDYPYGAFIASKAHRTNLLDFDEAERNDLAHMLKLVTGGMDRLFERPFPYMMVLHQAPVNGAAVDAFYHFHIEFYPPQYSKEKMKYAASSETGAWAPGNPVAVETSAPMLRTAIESLRGE
ncbi:galactose-1-phosphate uridylyltransferase [Alicyclobacillus sp. ALC3]|uniref:galactose-1-phosphate uridylyltransferase n=1 Tax=Alicyclobacillus sp. ALC3 TaxID=2796143 RepID=UPI00237950F5|nr:galactose-1-phosphate uridylyltransferase [Alicyclobacillus sp. ALC3]WDL95663.1 galactose-1-phosphate uridylyltransferase [Alicyclobacillus sp. ALC3]